jgi:hypothetical protein
MKTIQTITNIRIYKNKDGTLSRDLDRLVTHIQSIKRQDGEFGIEVVIGDSSYDDDVKRLIKGICDKYGAKYLHNGAKDLFNRGICINKTFLSNNSKTDRVVLLDLDHVIVKDMFLRCEKLSKDDTLVTCGIHFLTKSRVEIDEVSEDLVKFAKKDELRRLKTAKGFQFWRYSDFLKYGGVDDNFNLYCGTDDEILFRIKAEVKVNPNNEGVCFHINHEKLHLPKMENRIDFFCHINRLYLFSVRGRFKDFKFQNNLNNKSEYLCYDNKSNEVYWGTEDYVSICEKDLLAMSEYQILQLYLKNRGWIGNA